LVDVVGAVDGDTAHLPADSYYGGPLFYVYDEDSGLAENEPLVVDDDSVGGNQRWILQVKPLQAGGTGATSASAARTSLDAQQQDDTLDDLAGLTPEVGAIPYWDTVNSMARIRPNQSDLEKYILQIIGTYPNSYVAPVNTVNVSQIVFPKGDDPTVATEAECKWDSNSRALECYDDTAQLLATMQKCEDVTLATPDELQGESDWWPLKKFLAESFPHGVVIKAIHISTSATCTDALNFEECSDETCGTKATVEAITLSGTHTEDDGTLTDANIAADAILGVDLVDAQGGCDIAWMHFNFCYEIEDGN
jgi:hypothetical protein